MYFTRKRYTFNAFDGKSILSAHFDYPTDGEGLRFEYLAAYVNLCYDFVNSKLYEAVKNKYLSEYNKYGVFNRYYYDLKIYETYAEETLCSYLLCVSLKYGNHIVSVNADSVVFKNNMVIPPRFLHKSKSKVILLNADGIPSCAKCSAGQIQIEKLGKTKFSFL